MKGLNFYRVYGIISTCVIIFMTLYPVQNVHPHEYQMDITDDSLDLFDGAVHIGTVKWDTGSPLDSLIIEDNL